MFDELDRLRDVQGLFDLLTHYAELGRADRQVWQDRVVRREGLEPRELVTLHGELLAYGWIEQNTGATPILQPGAAPACYRITTVGMRALKQLEVEEMSTT